MLTRAAARFPCTSAFCGLPNACHFGESSRAYLTRQRHNEALIGNLNQVAQGRPKLSLLPGARAGHYFFVMNPEGEPAHKLIIQVIFALTEEPSQARERALSWSAVAYGAAL